jgi:hypothetical protein
VAEVLLVLPEVYGRGSLPYVVPEQIRSYPKLKILKIPVDLGPISKLLPAVEYVRNEMKDPDAIVITVDDDTAFPFGMVAEFIHQLVSHPATAVTGAGADLENWEISGPPLPMTPHNRGKSCKKAKATSYCDLVEGYGGVGYHVSDVDVDLMKRLSSKVLSTECHFSDDLVISTALALKGVNRLKIYNEYIADWAILPHAYGRKSDALMEGGGLDTVGHLPVLVSVLAPAPAPVLEEEKYQKCYLETLVPWMNEQSSSLGRGDLGL